MKVKDLLIEFTETIVTSFAVILLIYVLVAAVEVVSGSSMEPNFHTGERILVEKITKYKKPFQRGEIIVLYPPEGEKKHFIKRIIGIPGDVVKVFNCNVEVSRDGKQFMLKEAYLEKDTCTSVVSGFMKEGKSVKLSEDEYLVFGDNREFSIDSRSFGPLRRENIVGRVIFRFWPPNRFGFIH